MQVKAKRKLRPITQTELSSTLCLESTALAARKILMRRYDRGAKVERGDLTIDDEVEREFAPIVAAGLDRTYQAIDETLAIATLKDMVASLPCYVRSHRRR